MSSKNEPPAKEKKQLNEMSEEQYRFYEHSLHGHNVIGDACAGSGKSTTVLSIAKKRPELRMLQITYNKSLADDMRDTKKQLEIENLVIHTYHSLAVKYYNPLSHTDIVMRKVVDQDVAPLVDIPIIDILFIDECQDMTFLYFKLIVKFLKDMNQKVQLFFLGDYKQGLYEFKGADTRFLTHAHEIWKHFRLLKHPHFEKLTLKMSYRITDQMGHFVNNVMLGEKRLHTCRDGLPVVYLRRKIEDAQKFIITRIKQLMAEGASPADFFVLGASVKGAGSHIRKIENVLVRDNIPCHVPMNETERTEDKVINGKVVFCTFHSVKGRQRKYVFVVGFDNSYFKFYNKNMSDLECPNTLYVGTTRATHGLCVIENDGHHGFDRPLRFLKENHHGLKSLDYVDFKGIPQLIFKESEMVRNTEHSIVTPTELIRFISESVMEEVIPILDRIFTKISLKTDETEIEIPSIIQTKRGFYEEVSDLNGIAIPCIFFDYLKKKMLKQESQTSYIYDFVTSSVSSFKPGEHDFLREKSKKLPKKCSVASDYLYASNLYTSICEKLYFKLNQIDETEYNWLSDKMSEACIQRMEKVLGRECASGNFLLEKVIDNSDLNGGALNEKQRKIHNILLPYFGGKKFIFQGRIDLVTEDTVWELKCVSGITHEHMLQLVIYAWLWRATEENMETLENIKTFKLFNVRSGEVYLLHAEMQELTNIMVLLLNNKYGEKPEKSVDGFLNECVEYIEKMNAKIKEQ
jgi:hypothetical protein